MSLLQRAQTMYVRWESHWFDWRWGVQTRADANSLTQCGGSDHYAYLPTRPAVGSKILEGLPIRNHSSYTFVDYGSGKGRMLLLAARYPFHAVHGVEYDPSLHEQALANCKLIARSKKARSPISCFQMDAKQYELPASDLVLYFFNPFAPPVFTGVLERLRDSLQRQPRKVLLVMLYPESRMIAEVVPQLKQIRDEGRICVYSN